MFLADDAVKFTEDKPIAAMPINGKEANESHRRPQTAAVKKVGMKSDNEASRNTARSQLNMNKRLFGASFFTAYGNVIIITYGANPKVSAAMYQGNHSIELSSKVGQFSLQK